ncbi:ABC-2 type transporter-domain-containing protein [Lipomyces kononenkoae]|uniref:ABC-2 type transporter-domain-containing protein n=1 Tax=Lipomyces kononenkoae TaxID=34357 RepID=A0ACC3SUC4_LIPKO
MSSADNSKNAFAADGWQGISDQEDPPDGSYIGREEYEERVTQLAREVTRLSIYSDPGRVQSESGEGLNPFLDDSNDARLDPFSEKFSAKFFIKAMLDIVARDPETFPVRTAGIAFKDLSAHGFGSSTDYQKTVLNILLDIASSSVSWINRSNRRRIQILRDFEGVLRPGEMLMVLGRPGSGCSTLLKTITGETHGFHLDSGAYMNYQGVPFELMKTQFRGEVLYNAETDVHFPHLTVGQTLYFASLARTPSNRISGISREKYAEYMRDVVMAMLGLSHTINTKVGDDFVRGVSGGERKRVSIAEAMLGGAPLQCWDNSTRGLDSATALTFIRNLKLFAETTQTTSLVSLYQASQDAYDEFDKVIVLYEGRQIFFGSTKIAKKFFFDMGFTCPERQTTGDFLTSLTNPSERMVQPGFEDKVPRTPDEFARRWKESDVRADLMHDLDEFDKEYPLNGTSLHAFTKSRQANQADHLSIKSPYTISIPMQIRLCIMRGFQRLQGDLTLFFTTIISNVIMALVISSVFYNLPKTTGSFYARGSLLFFSILLNAFSSALEILSLYAQRPIVEKHTRYAYYHPFTEAVASMLCDMPLKILVSLSFNLTLYFMANLRREVGAFFTFLLFSFSVVMAMSMIFRTIASVSRTISQAMAPAGVLILMLVIYTGFAIPTRDMHPWFRWLNYLDPIAYGFESLMINEFRHRTYTCTSYIPSGQGYEGVAPDERICSVVGAITGQDYVLGDDYIRLNFNYVESHLWRNLGIVWAFVVFFCGVYLVATEYISAAKSKGEVLVFKRGQLPPPATVVDDEENALPRDKEMIESESSSREINLRKQTDIFFWKDVCYDIKIKGEPRRLLNVVDGFVKPGTLTALMGSSGAGKTTLLDVLASRVTMGVVTGEMLVNGHQRDSSFQRKTGYVQQQDLHLSTSTVREALTFSAVLRQPAEIPRAERIAYVDEVIRILEMEAYADAVVGVPGEGLNVEQRKRLTIGVELAAKPELLLFLDEPTSGLDSQTAWSICSLMRKLANNGQAILCTIHQPSAVLFQEFDRLLFLVKGGRTVYFGEIGENSKTLTSYFETNGAHRCPPNANPAEWMLEVVGAAPGSQAVKDWAEVWMQSPERAATRLEIDQMREELSKLPVKTDKSSTEEFSVGYAEQFVTVLKRVCEQYYRTPSYIWSKVGLATTAALFIGFSFWQAGTSLQGLQNQMFAVFMIFTIFGNLSAQLMPNFVTQRSLYEVRERPSKTYSWQAFMAANIIAEIPWQVLCAVTTYFSWYYPIGLYKNAEPMHQVHERGALMFLLILAFYIFNSTFAHMMVAGVEIAETASNLANLLFSLCLIFCGVLASPSSLPGFWIFMYRVSPFTYLVDAMLSVGVANTEVVCSDIELLSFEPAANLTCGEYLAPYISASGGQIMNPNATSDCEFCSISSTNVFLASVSSSYSHRWRDFGLLWVYIIFNMFAAILLYWLMRVPKRFKKKQE